MNILIDMMNSKDTDELFEKVETLLDKFGITAYNPDGSVKTLYDVLDEVFNVFNGGK